MEQFNKVCGASFEDLSHDEMMDYNGGGSLSPLVAASTIPCSVGASASISLVGSVYLIKNRSKKKKK